MATLLAAVAAECLEASGQSPVVGRQTRQQQPPPSAYSLFQVDSSLYAIAGRRYSNPIPLRQQGGALTALDAGYLLVTGDGMLYRVDENADRRSLTVRQSAARVPMNAAAFRRDVAGTAVNQDWFRSTGIVAIGAGAAARVYVAHHFWHAEGKCFTLRVSEVPWSTLWSNSAPADTWTLVYDSHPCLPIKSRSDPFAGHQAGGRIAELDSHTILFSVGDHQFDGVNADVAYAQDQSASYGKIIAIDRNTRQSRIYALGVRNPQGLFVDDTGAVWETEHGPQGGDELNRIHDGRNYGWPNVTYGVNYETHDWPPSLRQGRHDGYEEPVFAWIPSIGISNVVRIAGERFGRWQGDLVISSLDGEALWRVRLQGTRAVLTERIPIGVAVRDLVQSRDGRIAVWSDRSAALIFLEPQGSGAAVK